MQETIRASKFYPEVAFDTLYSKYQEMPRENNNIYELSFQDMYSNYDEKDKKFIDSMIKKYKITLDDAVDIFERCGKIHMMAEQLIEIL